MFGKYAFTLVAVLSVTGIASAGSSHHWGSKGGGFNFGGFNWDGWGQNDKNDRRDDDCKDIDLKWDWECDFQKKGNGKQLCELPELEGKGQDDGWGHLFGNNKNKGWKKGDRKDRKGSKWCKPKPECKPRNPKCETVPTPSAAAAGLLGLGLLAGRRNKKAE